MPPSKVAEDLLRLLACPECRQPLERGQGALRCLECRTSYPITAGIPDFLAP